MIKNFNKFNLDLLSGNFTKFLCFFMVLFFSLNLSAEEAASVIPAVTPEVAYILNTFLFLVCGFLVMFMAAGFCMLEAGMVRSKNTAVICLKNIGLFSIAGIMYFLVVYNLMYDGVDGGEPAGLVGEFAVEQSHVWDASSHKVVDRASGQVCVDARVDQRAHVCR